VLYKIQQNAIIKISLPCSGVRVPTYDPATYLQVIKKSGRVSVATTLAVPKIGVDGRRYMSMQQRGNNTASGNSEYYPILINPSWLSNG
jgi:hypothetical protein